MQRKIKYISVVVMTIISLCFAGCGDSSTKWAKGKWVGQTNGRPEYFTIKINADGTCKVFQEGRGLEPWHEEFEGEWEKVSDDVIKIYDYDGHMHVDLRSNHYLRNYRVDRWSMYLRKDGAFTPQIGTLDNPVAKLEKK